MRSILLIISFFITSCVFAQQQMGSFMAYGTESKYFSNLNYRVFQSKNGYLWFGTLNGLIRFDGKRYKNYFSNYADPNSPSDNVIFDIAEDKNGDLWFAGFYHGATRYNQRTGKFKKYAALSKDHNPYYGINRIVNDSKGELWFATSGRGLARYDFAKDSFDFFFPEPDKCRDGTLRGYNHITDIEEDRDDKNILWLGSFRGLCSFNKTSKAFTHYDLPTFEQTGFTACTVEQDQNGMLWVGTWGHGLQCFNKKEKAFIKDPPKTDLVVYDFVTVNDSLIYAACLNGGLYKLNTSTRTFTNITPPRNPSDPTSEKPDIQKVSITKDAGVFVGGNYYVYQQHPDFERMKKKITYPNPGSNSDNNLTSCIWDKKRQGYWLATSSGGMYWLENNSQQPVDVGFERNPDQVHKFFFDLASDGLDRIWVLSYYYGIYCWDDLKKTFVKPGALLPLLEEDLQKIVHLKSSKDGNLWMTTATNFIYWNIRDNKVDFFPITWDSAYKGPHNLSSSELNTDPDGDAWLFTQNGILHCKRKERKVDHIFKSGSTQNDLRSAIVLEGAFNKYNDVWITGGNGIQVMDRKTYEILANHNVDVGLPSMSVSSVVVDSFGRVWAGTASGIGLFDPKTKTWQSFNRMDGLERDYLDGYMDITSNNKLVMDEVGGFLIEDTKALMPLTDSPIIHITSITVNTENYSDSLLPEFIDGLTLPYDKNNIVIEFAAMDWRYPFKTTYHYRIDGLPSFNTLVPNNDCIISLTGLQPGTYTLHIQALNSNAVWSKEIVFRIIIKPPFWKTWWFITLIVLAIIGLMYALYRYRISRFLEMEKVRNTISRDLHDEIGASLSSANILSAVALMKAGKDNPTTPIIHQIKDAVQQAGESIDDIVWSVNPSNDAALDTFVRIRRYVTDITEPKGVNCVIDIDEPGSSLKLPMELRRDIYLVCKEAVNNALKYSGCTEIRLAIQVKQHRLDMSIGDNGKGFDISAIKASHRNGISNMKHRVEKHGGRFEIISEEGKGTRIECSVPV